MTEVPTWVPWLLLLLMSGSLGLSAWFDHYSKARLRKAIEYYQRAQAAWDEISNLFDHETPSTKEDE